MDMNLSTREIRYVLEVAEARSITKAAEKLFIAQPSLSQTIIKIEDKLGVKLFVRYKGRISLTSEGERFAKMGEQILRATKNFEKEILDINNLEMGRLIVGTPYLLGSFIIPHIIKLYKQKYPKINLQLVEETSQKLKDCLLNEKIDLAIMPIGERDERLGYEVLYENRMVLLVPKESELNRFAYDNSENTAHRFFDLRNAADQPFMIGTEGQWIRHATEAVFNRAGIVPPISMHSRNVDTIRQLVTAGMGLAILPESYICDGVCGCAKTSCRHSTLNSLNYYYVPEEQNYIWEVGIVHNRHNYLSNAARSFIETALDWSEENRELLTCPAGQTSVCKECPLDCDHRRGEDGPHT